MNLVIKDAVRQIIGRAVSAIGGFLVVKMITPYLGPLRFGDYSTILKYFAIRSALADFWLYVIGLKQLGKIKSDHEASQVDPSLDKRESEVVGETQLPNAEMMDITELPEMDPSTLQASSDALQTSSLTSLYGEFVGARLSMILLVYILALVVAYFIPSYTANPYLVRWLPLGMVFSASFMTAGILQLPLQLFRKMEQVSIWLTLARISQLSILVIALYIIFPHIDFTWPAQVMPFNRILLSVIMSGVTQGLYVRRKSNRYLKLHISFDRSFSLSLLKGNRQYGLAYYLSSFHTLIVLIMLSRFFPTIEGYTATWVRAIALSLIEILLIIPSSLGNSLIHKVASMDKPIKQQKFGALLELIVWIGGCIILLFSTFNKQIISFLGGSSYLGSATQWGADTVLPFLAVVLTLSFIKQIFNYLFVATDQHNKLLRTNLFGVIVWLIVGIPLIMRYQLLWGVVTQLLLEYAFTAGAIRIARKHDLLPKASVRRLVTIIGGAIVLGNFFLHPFVSSRSFRQAVAGGLFLCGVLVLVSFRWIKKLARQL